MTIAEQIKEIRKSKKITQKQIAELLPGKHNGHLSVDRYRLAERLNTFTNKQIIKICKILKCEIIVKEK